MYAKVFAQMYDGTLCTRGPWESLVTFQQLLVLSDPDGNVDMTAEAISRRTTIPLEIIKKGLEELQKPDPESRTPTDDGKRIVPLCEGRSWGWRIVNYVLYRGLKREEDRREYHRNYWNEKRSPKAKSSGTQKTQSSSTELNSLNGINLRSRKETETNEVKGKRKATAAPRPVFDASSCELPDGLSRALWTEWCNYRKSRRKPISPLAATQQIAQLTQWKAAGLDVEQSIRSSIANDYTGLFEPKAAFRKPAGEDEDPMAWHWRKAAEQNAGK